MFNLHIFIHLFVSSTAPLLTDYNNQYSYSFNEVPPHKRTLDSLDWQSHPLNLSAQHRSPPELRARPPTVNTVHP